MNEKLYLGDGVYVEYKTCLIKLTANVPKTDTIYLSVREFAMLLIFARRIGWKFEGSKEKQNE